MNEQLNLFEAKEEEFNFEEMKQKLINNLDMLKEMSVEEQKASEILKYIEFETRGWLFDENKRVTHETPGYFLENNYKMVAKIANILRK